MEKKKQCDVKVVNYERAEEEKPLRYPKPSSMIERDEVKKYVTPKLLEALKNGLGEIAKEDMGK